MTTDASGAGADRKAKRSTRRLLALALAGVGVLALAVLYVLEDRPWLFRGGVEYQAVFRSVAGLREDDEVRYAGLEVGAVTSVVVDTANPARLVVTFRVRDDIPIRADTRASIPPFTLPVAPYYLTLEPGSQKSPPLPPGSVVPTEETPSLQDVFALLANVLDRTDTLLNAARPVIERDFFGHLDRTVSRADTLLAVASRHSGRLLTQLEEATRRANTMLAHTNRLLAALDSSQADLAAVPREAVAALHDTRVLVGEVRQGLAGQGGLADLMYDLASATENLADLTARLERNPISVLQPRRPPNKVVGPKP